MIMHDKAPPTSDDVEELDRFLLNAEGIDNSMDISSLDGFLTAIVCAPAMIMPSEWMRWVWDMERGEDSPEFESDAQAHRIIGLLMQHMDGIARTLMERPDQYAPILLQNSNHDDPVPILDDWCEGFMLGVGLDAKGWSQILTEQAEWMSTILLYGTKEGTDVLESKSVSAEDHKAFAEKLSGDVQKIHALCLEQRRQLLSAGQIPNVVRRAPVRAESKAARNDPCPCGSGKKFKRCHGDPARMH